VLTIAVAVVVAVAIAVWCLGEGERGRGLWSEFCGVGVWLCLGGVVNVVTGAFLSYGECFLK